MTPEQQFVSAIANSIRSELLSQSDKLDGPIVGCSKRDELLLIDGCIDIDWLAQAVHKTIIEYQAPNF